MKNSENFRRPSKRRGRRNNSLWNYWRIINNVRKERKETIKFAIEKVGKRVKVIAGTGSNNTKSAIEMSKYAEVLEQMLLVVTPYYNKTTQKGLVEHYKAIAKK